MNEILKRPLKRAWPRQAGWSASATLVTLSVATLVVITGLLVTEVLALRTEVAGRPPGARFHALQELMESTLEGCNGEPYRIAEDDREFRLIYFFSPYDCPICHEELMDIEVLAQEHPELSVYGVMSWASSEEACQTSRNFGLSVPILVDPEGRFIETLGIPETPWKVLVERTEGRTGIAFEDPKSSTPAEREAFQSRIRLLLGYGF